MTKKKFHNGEHPSGQKSSWKLWFDRIMGMMLILEGFYKRMSLMETFLMFFTVLENSTRVRGYEIVLGLMRFSLQFIPYFAFWLLPNRAIVVGKWWMYILKNILIYNKNLLAYNSVEPIKRASRSISFLVFYSCRGRMRQKEYEKQSNH